MTIKIHVEDKLSQYIDGVLSARETRLVEEHLAACGLCSAAFSDLKKARELVHDQEEVDVPAWFTKKVMARLAQEVEPEKNIFEKLFRPLRTKIPIEVMATCIVVVLALYLYRTMGPEMTTHVNPREKTPAAPEQTMREPPAETSLPARPDEEKTRGISNGLAIGETGKPAGRAHDTRTDELKKEESAAAKSSEQEAALRQTEKPQAAGTPNQSAAGPARESVATAVPPDTQSRGIDRMAPFSTGSATPGTVTAKKGPQAFSHERPMQRAIPREIVISVYTEYREAATEKIEAELKRFGARNVSKENREDREVFIALVAGQSVKGLFDALKTAGEVRSADITANTSEDYTTVRIEIRGSP